MGSGKFGDDTDDKYGSNDLSQVKLLEGEITFSNSKQYTAKYVSTRSLFGGLLGLGT